jgi:hypothetical protein
MAVESMMLAWGSRKARCRISMASVFDAFAASLKGEFSEVKSGVLNVRAPNKLTQSFGWTGPVLWKAEPVSRMEVRPVMDCEPER